MYHKSDKISSMPKPEIKIYHAAIVCKGSKLRGDITIGSSTIIHPCANIIAEAGPIVIGDGNVIEEKVTIINRLSKLNETMEEPNTLYIGNNNVFEVGSTIESLNIGDNNVMEPKSYIANGVELGKNCCIGAGCRLTVPEQLPDNTIVFGSSCQRRISDKPQVQHSQRDFLCKVLPNYHHLKKSKKLTESINEDK